MSAQRTGRPSIRRSINKKTRTLHRAPSTLHRYNRPVPVSDLLAQDAADLAEDARRMLTELDQAVPGAAKSSGECRPPLDVLETSKAIEVVVDLPGVPASAVRVAVRRQTLLVVGIKLSTIA